jgi:N-acetylglucosamine malate deacetylase 1
MKVIVFSPHPDDAEILMGGAIARYAQKGHEVLIVVVTVPNQNQLREKEAKAAADILGAKISILNMNPYEISFGRKMVEIFDNLLNDFSPEVIYTSWCHDSHQDHVAVSLSTIAASRKNNCSLYMYEQANPSGITPAAFKAQTFIDITDTFNLKSKAILAHESQYAKYGEKWLDAIEGRASYWGFRCNCDYAEAFELVRDIKEI